jgi:hypothetical protein
VRVLFCHVNALEYPIYLEDPLDTYTLPGDRHIGFASLDIDAREYGPRVQTGPCQGCGKRRCLLSRGDGRVACGSPPGLPCAGERSDF